MTREEWRKLRRACLERDDFTCQRCGYSHKKGTYLSAHHIIPRAEGGANMLANLITLCDRVNMGVSCHNAVELKGYRTRTEICCMDDEPIKSNQLDDNFQYDAGRPSWHRFVYGGGKNPNL